MNSVLFKILLMSFAAVIALLTVAILPISYLNWPGRGIVGHGLFIFISHGTFYGLFFYSVLFCSITGLVLKLPRCINLLLTVALTSCNISILLLDVKFSKYPAGIEKIIMANFGSTETIYLYAIGISLFGFCLLIASFSFLVKRYK